MGMSIEEAIPILHDMYNYYNDTDIDAYVGFDNEDNNAIETALDTIHKYQKIVEILNSASYKEDGKTYSYTYDEDSRVKHIRQVVEDGQNTIKD